MKLISILIFFFLYNFAIAQESETIYYKNKYYTQETSKAKRAKSKVVISSENGITTKKYFLLSRGKENIASVKYFKGEIPVGKWEYYTNGKLSRTDDYNVDLDFSEEKFDSEFYFDLGKTNTTEKEGMTPPELLGYEDIFHGIYGQLKYPAYARENGIQGEVVLNIKITKEGELKIISILKSDHPTLLIAAIDAMKKCNSWKPALYKNEAIDSYAIMPIKFKLEG